jgi:hypothetical protein
MRRLVAADRIAHWRLEETSGTLIADDAGTSNLTSASSANIVSGPFAGESGNAGRTTSFTMATGASTAGQRAALVAGLWTAQVWVRPASLHTSFPAIAIAHGHLPSGGPPTTSNHLLQFSRNGAKIQCVWEATGGTPVISTTAADYLTALGLHHIAARCTPTGATRRLEIFVDGLLRQTFSGLAAAFDGASGGWLLGSAPGGGQPWDGQVYEVSLASVALSDEAILESYARGVCTWDRTRAIASQRYAVHTRARIRDSSGKWIDLGDLYDTDFVNGFDDDDDVDADGATGMLILRRRSMRHSIAPLMASSRANAADPGGQLLAVTRRIKIEECVVPAGASRELVGDVHWQLVFDGYARAVGDGEAEVITLELADRIRALQVAWVQPDRAPNPDVDFTYAATPTAIETVLAQQLVDWVPAEGFGGGDGVTLYVPTSPAFTINNAPAGFSVPADESVAQAQADLVDQLIAWHLRYRWDDLRQEYRYTLSDPGRSRTWSSTDPTIEADQVLRRRRLEISEEDIRNDIEVEYGDAAAGDNLTVNERKSVRVSDAGSIAKYWRRYARVGLAHPSELSDSAQATDLANRMLSDLKDPLAHIEIDVLPRREIEIGDVVKLKADGIRHDTDLTCAVVGIRHSRSAEGRLTSLSLRAAAPVGRRRRMLDIVDQVGSKGGRGLKPPITPIAPTIDRIDGGLVVRWPFPANIGNRRYDATEVHLDAVSSGFTPSTSTLKALVRGVNAAPLALTPGVEQHVKIVHRDLRANKSGVSPVASAKPRHRGSSLYARAYRATDTASYLSKGDNYFTMTTALDVFSTLSTTGSPSRTRFTAPVTGFYRFDCGARAGSTDPSDLADSVRIRLILNGTTAIATGDAPVEDNEVQALLNTALRVQAGEYVDMSVLAINNDTDYQGNFVIFGDATGNFTWFSAHLVDEI